MRPGRILVFSRLADRLEADEAMVDELDETCALDAFHRGNRSRNQPLVELDVVFHDDGHPVAAGDKLLKREQMAAIASVFAGQKFAAVMVDERMRVEIDAIRVGDDAAVDSGYARNVEVVLHGLTAQMFPAITRAVEIDDIDRDLLSGIVSDLGVSERGDTTNLFENDGYSCKQKSRRRQLR